MFDCHTGEPNANGSLCGPSSSWVCRACRECWSRFQNIRNHVIRSGRVTGENTLVWQVLLHLVPHHASVDTSSSFNLFDTIRREQISFDVIGVLSIAPPVRPHLNHTNRYRRRHQTRFQTRNVSAAHFFVNRTHLSTETMNVLRYSCLIQTHTGMYIFHRHEHRPQI